MPMLAAVPWLVPLITGIGAATTTGLSIAEAVGGGGGGSSAASSSSQQQEQQKAAAQKLAQQKAAFLNSQNPTSGNPGGLATPAGSDIQAMLKVLNPAGQATGASISGGIEAATPGPQPTNGLTNLAI